MIVVVVVLLVAAALIAWLSPSRELDVEVKVALVLAVAVIWAASSIRDGLRNFGRGGRP